MSHDVTPQPTGAAAHGHKAPGHDTHGHADHGTSHPHVNYLAIFIALCVCTALSVAFDLIDINKRVVAVLVLAVAVAKAQYVMRYFMHLKFEGLWKYVLLLPTAILSIGLPLALAPDVAMHYYTPERDLRSQTAEVEGPEPAQAEGTAH